VEGDILGQLLQQVFDDLRGNYLLDVRHAGLAGEENLKSCDHATTLGCLREGLMKGV